MIVCVSNKKRKKKKCKISKSRVVFVCSLFDKFILKIINKSEAFCMSSYRYAKFHEKSIHL